MEGEAAERAGRDGEAMIDPAPNESSSAAVAERAGAQIGRY